VALRRRNAKYRLWVHPDSPGASRGAGSKKYYPIQVLNGRLPHIIHGPEQPTTYLDNAQVLFFAFKRSPTMKDNPDHGSTLIDPSLLTFLG